MLGIQAQCEAGLCSHSGTRSAGQHSKWRMRSQCMQSKCSQGLAPPPGIQENHGAQGSMGQGAGRLAGRAEVFVQAHTEHVWAAG